jgi:hypothetical protein
MIHTDGLYENFIYRKSPMATIDPSMLTISTCSSPQTGLLQDRNKWSKGEE